MPKHVVVLDYWDTEKKKVVYDGDPHGTSSPAFVRWSCSCYRIGPAMKLGKGTETEAAEAKARRGGAQHVKRHTR